MSKTRARRASKRRTVACPHCLRDGDNFCAYPYYGFADKGEFVRGKLLRPGPRSRLKFRPDPNNPGWGVYTHCPECGAGEREGPPPLMWCDDRRFSEPGSARLDSLDFSTISPQPGGSIFCESAYIKVPIREGACQMVWGETWHRVYPKGKALGSPAVGFHKGRAYWLPAERKHKP